jgi:hypothetical protein
MLDRRPGVARVVLHPSDPVPPAYRPLARPTSSWGLVAASDFPTSVEESARAVGAAGTFVLDAGTEAVVRALWLPPAVLYGYSQLRRGVECVLVIDDWHDLVRAYLGGPAPARPDVPSEHTMDEILVDAFESISEAHFVVVARARSTILERRADAILDVGLAAGGPSRVRVQIVRDPLEVPPLVPYLLDPRSD